MCYWFALHLTSPVRALQKAVERFGRGDLRRASDRAAATNWAQLARTFDRMAGRMETLMTAERRLLLDISHELRSPLARLGVAVELARSGEDRDARRRSTASRRNPTGSTRWSASSCEVTRAEGDPSSLRRDAVRLDEAGAAAGGRCRVSRRPRTAARWFSGARRR